MAPSEIPFDPQHRDPAALAGEQIREVVQAFAEGGYEPSVSHLDPIAEKVYLRQIGELLKRFH